MSRILLCDANNLAMRAIFAADRTGMQANGIPTGALLVFINMLSRHVREEQPDSVVVCWDGGKSQVRQAIYPAYKAQREARPEDEADTRPFPQMKEFLILSNIHHVERDGWEADDLIAVYWQRLRRTAEHISILSADKDLLQLVSHNVVQVRPASKPPTDYWDVARVRKELGCAPENVPTMMSLMGDAGDNVPGLPGIGPKKSVLRMNSLDWDLEAYFDTYNIAPEMQEQVRMSYRLVDLRGMPYASYGLSVQEPPPFDPTNPGSINFAALISFLDRYRLEGVKSRLLDGSLWKTNSEDDHVRTHRNAV